MNPLPQPGPRFMAGTALLLETPGMDVTLERSAAENVCSSIRLPVRQPAGWRRYRVWGPIRRSEIITEVGPGAATFPSAAQIASDQISLLSRKGRKARRSQKTTGRRKAIPVHAAHSERPAANATVRAKGSVFEILYHRRLVEQDPDTTRQSGRCAHRLCRITWKVLHEGVTYEERGQRTALRAIRQGTNQLNQRSAPPPDTECN